MHLALGKLSLDRIENFNLPIISNLDTDNKKRVLLEKDFLVLGTSIALKAPLFVRKVQ